MKNEQKIVPRRITCVCRQSIPLSGYMPSRFLFLLTFYTIRARPFLQPGYNLGHRHRWTCLGHLGHPPSGSGGRGGRRQGRTGHLAWGARPRQALQSLLVHQWLRPLLVFQVEGVEGWMMRSRRQGMAGREVKAEWTGGRKDKREGIKFLPEFIPELIDKPRVWIRPTHGHVLDLEVVVRG